MKSVFFKYIFASVTILALSASYAAPIIPGEQWNLPEKKNSQSRAKQSTSKKTTTTKRQTTTSKQTTTPRKQEEVKKETVKEQTVVREEEIVNNQDSERIFVAVEQPAEFPGGQAALMKWLSNNMKYPEEAQNNGVQGRVIVKFVIEKDGSISDVTVVRGVDKDLDAEAIRIVRKMPKWNPGKNNGVPVRSYYNFPISFKLAGI